MAHAADASVEQCSECSWALSPAAHRMIMEVGTSGAAVCAASSATNPIDVVKVRLQLQSSSAGPGASLLGIGANIVRNEGVTRACKTHTCRLKSCDMIL
jgi:hypothetical protein